MRRFTILLVALSVPWAAQAQYQYLDKNGQPLVVQQPTWTPPSGVPQKPDATKPITGELDGLFNSLSEQLKSVEALMPRLKELSGKAPETAQSQVEEAAKVLSALVDKLRPDGDMAAQFNAMRQSAQTNRERIEKLSPDTLSEQDRTSLLNAWKKVGEDIDKLSSKTGEVRERISQSLKTLRMRQAAIGEFLLVGQFNAALASINSWVSSLETTVNSLRSTLNANRPSM